MILESFKLIWTW